MTEYSCTAVRDAMNTLELLLLALHIRFTAASPDTSPRRPALYPMEGQPLPPLLLGHQLLPCHQDPTNTATAQALIPSSLQLSLF